MRTKQSLRRMALTLGTALLLVVGACSSAPSERIGSGDNDYGVFAAPPLPIAAPDATFDPASDIANLDGSVVVTVSDGHLLFTDRDAGIVASVPVNAGAELRAVSADGNHAAVFEQVEDAISRITVFDRIDAEIAVTSYDLPGLVEPEAFSTNGRVLFVIDHQISEVPGAYRIRPLNLETGLLEAIVGPSKVPFQDDMNGIGRRQVWSPDGSRLYTLYIRQTHHHHSDGSDHAHGEAGTDGFVHVLDLNKEWAFCLDLPATFGGGDLLTTALAVSPDGGTIAIVDASSGEIAFASTIGLAVRRTATMPELEIENELHLGLTSTDLLIGFGSEVHWFDQQTLTSLTAEPARLDARLIAITSNGQTALAWTTDSGLGPVSLPAPTLTLGTD